MSKTVQDDSLYESIWKTAFLAESEFLDEDSFNVCVRSDSVADLRLSMLPII
jgi:hypothetical protein